MSPSTDQNSHKPTPRTPSNALFEKIVPIAIGVMGVILIIVIAAVVFAPLLNGGR